MKRTDRLMAILIALQLRPETAQSLADKFEVSKRTILRDMQSLGEMGVPLYSMTGPAGGYRFMDGFRLPPLQLDSQEALAALFALRSMAKMADTPFNSARWTVMDKIKAVLPAQTLNQIEPVLEHVSIEMPERKVKTPHLSALLEHAAQSRWLDVLYRSANHRRRLRILPQKLYIAHGFWYCDAYSLDHGERRTFRLDRFEAMEVIAAPNPAEQPFPKSVETDAGQSAPPDRVTARLTYRGALAAEQDIHIGECVRQLSDDEWEVDFLCPAAERAWAARFFFFLGDARRSRCARFAAQRYF